MAPTKTQLAWAAGFIDGEGSIHFIRHTWAKKQPLYYPHLTVAQVDPRPLLVLKEMFGGSIHLHPDSRGNNSDYWRWAIAARKGQKALKQMLPYLVLKKEHAELAIAYQGLVGKSGTNRGLDPKNIEERDIIRKKVIQLNKTGRV